MNKGPTYISYADIKGVRKTSAAPTPDQTQENLSGLADFAFAMGGDTKVKYWSSPEKSKTAPLKEVSPNTREKRDEVYNDAVNAMAARKSYAPMARQSNVQSVNTVVGFDVVEADDQEVDTSEKRKPVARNLFK